MYPIVDNKKTAKNLKMIMEQQGITVKELQKHLGLTCVQTVYHWLEGKAIPSVDNLYAMCGLFGVSMNEIVGGNMPFIDDSTMRNSFRRYRHYWILSNQIIYEKEFYS